MDQRLVKGKKLSLFLFVSNSREKSIQVMKTLTYSIFIRKSDIILIDNKLKGDDHMMKVNDIYIEKLENDQYKVKEWNEKKKMFYISTYTSDEIEMYFNIKKEDLK